MIELSKYMHWRVLPRQLKVGIRRYLMFVWDCNEHVGETESSVMDQLSPTLRMSLCLHIFGQVIRKAPFLKWMGEYPAALKKLALRTRSLFRESNDVLFTFGEIDSSILILVNGWVTLSLGAHFEDRIQDNFEQDTKSDFAPIRKSK